MQVIHGRIRKTFWGYITMSLEHHGRMIREGLESSELSKRFVSQYRGDIAGQKEMESGCTVSSVVLKSGATSNV